MIFLRSNCKILRILTLTVYQGCHLHRYTSVAGTCRSVFFSRELLVASSAVI